MKLTDRRYLSGCAALAILAIAWGAIAAVIERVVPAGTPVVVTRNGVNETIAVVTTQPVDIRLIPQPATQPSPPPAPIIPGNRIPSGGKIPNTGTNLLEYGGTYTATLAPESNASYLAVGDPAKGLPIIKGNARFDGKTGVVFNGVKLQGAGKPGVVGLDILNSSKVRFLNGAVTGFGANGLNIQGYGGKRCSDVVIQGTLIANNFPADPSKHCEGFYTQATDGLVIDGCVIAENGGAPGIGTQYNQGGYVHASCTPATVTNCVFYRNAAHGLQQRSGGPHSGNVFIDNPVAFSYGLVNGEACYPGGVSGLIENDVIIGGGAVAGGPNAGRRGWAMDLSNAKAVTIRRVIIAHDNQNFSKAIHVANCANLTNAGSMLPANKWGLTLRDVWVYDWAPGPMEISATYVLNGKTYKATPTMTNVGNPPPQQPNLRAVLGDGFMPWARLNPTLAAPAAVTKCFAACGVK